MPITNEADLSKIKAIALDVDGVLTDGGFWWGPTGEEWKRFSFRDVMGVSLAHQAGLIVALIGLQMNMISQCAYALVLMMTAITTIVPPPIMKVLFVPKMGGAPTVPPAREEPEVQISGQIS